MVASRATPSTLTYERFPKADPAWLVDDEIELPVQVNGKVRAHIQRSGRRRRRPRSKRGTRCDLVGHLASATVEAGDHRRPTVVVNVSGQVGVQSSAAAGL